MPPTTQACFAKPMALIPYRAPIFDYSFFALFAVGSMIDVNAMVKAFVPTEQTPELYSFKLVDLQMHRWVLLSRAFSFLLRAASSQEYRGLLLARHIYPWTAARHSACLAGGSYSDGVRLEDDWRALRLSSGDYQCQLIFQVEFDSPMSPT